MISILLMLLLGPPTIAPPEQTELNRCLPDGSGFLSMRLRGSIEEEVRWQEPALACTGMSRPDNRGIRLRFAGQRDGGELAIVFAPPNLTIGASARGVPVNVTLLDEAGQRIYGTQGDRLCVLDEIEQHAIEGPGLQLRRYRVEGRGFCTAPARAVDGGGAVLLTRFDFVGRLDDTAGEASEPLELSPDAEPLERFPEAEVMLQATAGLHRIKVWVADTPARQQQGLMYVRALPPGRGMLFPFDAPRYASFWMLNTFIPLDLLFIGQDGRIVNIIENAKPLSMQAQDSQGPVVAVLELAGGTCARIGLRAGDLVLLPTAASVPVPGS